MNLFVLKNFYYDYEYMYEIIYRWMEILGQSRKFQQLITKRRRRKSSRLCPRWRTSPSSVIIIILFYQNIFNINYHFIGDDAVDDEAAVKGEVEDV